MQTEQKTERWYLDLDGVRSGPYESTEIEALFTAGELLAQHKISESISNPKWLSIVEWRLLKTFQEAHHAPKQEKKIANEEPVPELKIEFTTPIVEEPVVLAKPLQPEEVTGQIKIELAEPVQPIAETKEYEAAPKVEIIKEPVAPTPTLEITAPAAAPANVTTPPPFSERKIEAKPSADTPTVSAATASPTASAGADPTAELFELFQSSKQKREKNVNQAAASQQAQFNTSFAEKKPMEWKKPSAWAGLVLGLALLGYGIGSAFKPNKSTDTKPAESASASSTKTEKPKEEIPVINTASNPPPAAAPNEQVVDRSNKQFTIRSKVIGSLNNMKVKPATPKAEVTTRGADLNPEEIKELRELRKELEELRNLRTNDAIEEDPDVTDEAPDAGANPGIPGRYNPAVPPGDEEYN